VVSFALRSSEHYDLDHMFASSSQPPPTGDDADRRLAEIEAEGAQVAAEISRLQARLVELAAEAASLQGRLVGMTPRAWVTWRFGLTPAEGGRVMRLADRLPALPKLADAFESGQLSEGVVDTLARAATPATEAQLLDLSTVATGAQLQILVRDHQRAGSSAGAALVGPTDRHPYVSINPGDDGWWDLRGFLSPRDGAVVDAAVRAAAETSKPPQGPWPTTADGLVRIAEQHLDGHAPAGGPVPERFETIVVLDRDGPVLQGTGPIDGTTFREILCESTLAAVVRQHGEPIVATSRQRYATGAQLRALRVRDRCCRFPGCGITHGLIAHHLRPFADGGETRLDNLLLLCRMHHRVIHRPGWSIEPGTDGRPMFSRADGTTVTPACRRSASTSTSTSTSTPTGGPDDDPPPSGIGVPDAKAAGPRPRTTSPRRVGAHEPLTEFGRDVILHNWLAHESNASGETRPTRDGGPEPDRPP
jgi:hypothetical protein